MLAHRYQIGILLVLVALLSLYLLLPLVASHILARGLRNYGYKHVIVQLGYPGWHGMSIPVVSFQQDLAGESLMVSLTDAEIEYHVARLVRGHVDRVSLPYVAVQILTVSVPSSGPDDAGGTSQRSTGDETSPWSLLTAGDLLRNLPILPFDEVDLDRVTIFREQATGPLRKVTISGNVKHRDGELGGQLLFQGRDTASYGLTVTGHSASTWSATLVSQRPQPVPLLSWQSQARPDGAQIHVSGRFEANVRELAPFIALLVPIGPELERVTGHVAVSLAGVASADATLTSLWEDPHTKLNGTAQVNVTLPALKGIAKDLAVAYEGSFTGNATQVGWTLAPGLLVTATVNTQPHIIPEAVRTILPHGDQPVRIDNPKLVQGMLYWAEAPVRMTVEGPLHVTYGHTRGPLVAEFETSHAEIVGNELVLAEGTYHVEGILPESVTGVLSAKEATGGFRGTVTLARTNIQGVLLPSSSVTARQIEQGTVAVTNATLQLTEPLPVQCDLVAVHCTAGPATVAIRVPDIRVTGRKVRIGQSMLRMQQAESQGAQWKAQGTLSASGVAVDLAPWGLPEMNIAADLMANQAGIKAEIRADAPTRGRFMIATIEQPFSAADGVLKGTIGPIDFNTADRRLSKLLKGLPASTDLTDGQVTATVDMSWSGGIRGTSQGLQLISATAKIIVDKLSGHYQEYVVKGVSTTMTLRADELGSIATVQPALVTITSVQTGVEVSNLATMLHLNWSAPNELPVVNMKELRCGLFGGAVTSPGLVVDLEKPPYRATLSLQNLDLAKILKVEQQKGLEGTGTLNGTLPVRMTPHGLAIENGVVEALPPGGVIRYVSSPESSKALAESDSHLQLVAQALNNFHYTTLRVGVEYAENGTLDLSARLEGRNPDLQKSPPIHFNLTVQEHVPTLLKSLRLVQDIRDGVQKKFK